MKVKCIKCDLKYLIEQNKCPSCGSFGGYMQEPAMKDFGNLKVHLEDIIKHSPTSNLYQVKEIQSEGLIAKSTHSILPAIIGKKVYISNNNITEYENL